MCFFTIGFCTQTHLRCDTFVVVKYLHTFTRKQQAHVMEPKELVKFSVLVARGTTKWPIRRNRLYRMNEAHELPKTIFSHRPQPPTTTPPTTMRVQTAGPGSSGYEPNRLDPGKALPSARVQGTRVQAAGPGSNGYTPNKVDAGKFAPSGQVKPGFVRAGTKFASI